MADNTIHGKFEYNEKVYPFFLADHIITVPQTPHEFNRDFADTYHLITLKALLTIISIYFSWTVNL